jgi:hypothetical protein
VHERRGTVHVRLRDGAWNFGGGGILDIGNLFVQPGFGGLPSAFPYNQGQFPFPDVCEHGQAGSRLSRTEGQGRFRSGRTLAH